MSTFTTVGDGWSIEDLDDELGADGRPHRYHVYVIWSGKRFCGVASGDGMEDLLESVALARVKKEAKFAELHHVRFRAVRVGPTPGAQSANALIEVEVVPMAREQKIVGVRAGDALCEWRVAGIRDVQPGKKRTGKYAHERVLA